MRVLIIGVGLLDIAAQAIDRQVHLGEVDGFLGLFLPIDEDAAVPAFQVLAMLPDELRRLHEHAAGAARGIEHLAAMRLDDLDHETNDRTGCEDFAALGPFATGKLGKEVFVNLPEEIAAELRRDVGETFQELIRDVLCLRIAGEAKIFILGQDAFEFRFIILDRLHGFLERLGDVLFLRKFKQVVVTGAVRQIKAALLDGDIRDSFLPPRALELLELGHNFRLMLAIVVISEFEEDQPENGNGILAGFEVGIRPEIICGAPKIGFKLLELCSCHGQVIYFLGIKEGQDTGISGQVIPGSQLLCGHQSSWERILAKQILKVSRKMGGRAGFKDMIKTAKHPCFQRGKGKNLSSLTIG